MAVKVIVKKKPNIKLLEKELNDLSDELFSFRIENKVKTSVWCKYFQHVENACLCDSSCPDKCSMFRSFRFICKFPGCSEFNECVRKKYWCKEGLRKKEFTKKYIKMRRKWRTKKNKLDKLKGKKKLMRIPFFSEFSKEP